MAELRGLPRRCTCSIISVGSWTLGYDEYRHGRVDEHCPFHGRLPRVAPWFPGVSCEHPMPFDITVMGDAYTTVMCSSCLARWHRRKGMIR